MTKKIKIVFIISSFLGGGAEKNLVQVANNLDISKFEIFIVCLTSKGPYYELINKRNVTIIDCEHPGVYFSIFKLYRIIRKIKPDVIAGWMGYLNAYLSFFIPLFSKRIKWVCRESSVPSMANKILKLEWLFTFLYKFYNGYQIIICQSDAMALDLIKNFKVKKDKIRIINNPVDFSMIENNNRLGNNEFKFNLLYVGGLRKEKRVELLIQTFQLLPETYFLRIIGDGEEINIVKNLIGKLKLNSRVEIITNCYNPYPYYFASDAVLLCSLFEGFPNVITESFACGCPAIGFNIIGGADEVLNNYGGFIVKGTIKEFADEIITVCEKSDIDRQKIIDNCKERYNIKKSIKKYEEVLV